MSDRTSRLGATAPIEQMAKILVEEGATNASAAIAAIILSERGTYDEAKAVIELAAVPEAFDSMLLLAELARRREHALVEVGA